MKDQIKTLYFGGKIPPQAIDLEESVLGAILMDFESLDRIIELKPRHFYKQANQEVFSAILNLNSKNQPIDLFTVSEELKRLSKLEEVGGPYYLTTLTSKIASSAHIEFHANIIKQKYLQRELIRISHEIQIRSFDDSADVDELIDYVNASIELATNEVFESHEMESFPQVLKNTIESLKKREALYKQGKVGGIPTPVLELTKVTNGWQNGDLIVLAARPGMGKTAFVLACAKKAAKEGYFPVIFSLEMDNVGLAGRILVGESGVDPYHFKTGSVNSLEWKKIDEAVSELYKLGITIDDNPNASMEYVKAKCRILKKKNKCSIIILDYLQLANPDKSKKGGNREQEVSDMSRKAKLMAKELNVPVILLSQLSRAVELRTGHKRPMLSDLRESGAIEQDADIVSFIYRPEYYGFNEDENGEQTKGIGEFIIAKHRNGDVCTVKFGYNESLTQIYDCLTQKDMQFYANNLEPNTDF